jgi:tripartite-type tricarboxylate transporter receptor subunit TctC
MYVAKAPADGYTLLMAAGAMIVASPNTQPDIVKYDTTRDLEPIGIAAELPVVMVTNPEVPARNFRELVSYAKANAGKLTCASTGIGTAGHLACVQLEKTVGGDLPHVAYKGAPEANADLIANRVQIYFGVVPTQIGFIQQGRLRAIGVASDERLPTAADIPTLREQGFPVSLPAWNALFVPASTPKPVLERLRAEHRKTLADPAVRQQIEKSQAVIRNDSSAEDLRRLITQDFAVFRKLAVEAVLRKD